MMIEVGAATVPGVIEPTRFAREHSSVTGVLALSQLPRLAEVLFDHEGGVRAKIQAHGYQAHAVFTLSEISQTLYQTGRITEAQYGTIAHT